MIVVSTLVIRMGNGSLRLKARLGVRIGFRGCPHWDWGLVELGCSFVGIKRGRPCNSEQCWILGWISCKAARSGSSPQKISLSQFGSRAGRGRWPKLWAGLRFTVVELWLEWPKLWELAWMLEALSWFEVQGRRTMAGMAEALRAAVNALSFELVWGSGSPNYGSRLQSKPGTMRW